MAPRACGVDATGTCGESGRSYPGRSGGGSSCQKSAEAVVAAETPPRGRAEQEASGGVRRRSRMTKTPTAPEGGRRQAKKVKPSGSAGAMASQTPARQKSESLGSGVDLLEAMLERENLVRAWERVKANKG